MTNQFQNIGAWQKAHEFVLLVYRTTQSFPDFERFGLCSQFQRVPVSIPANIAEGYKKLSRADKLRFYNIAQGSLEECRYYIILSKDLGYIKEDGFKGSFDPLFHFLPVQADSLEKIGIRARFISARAEIHRRFLLFQYVCRSQAKPPAGRTTAPALRGQPAIRSV